MGVKDPVGDDDEVVSYAEPSRASTRSSLSGTIGS